MGLGLKVWSLSTGFCNISGEADKCRSRIRIKVEGGFDLGGRQIMSRLTQVKGRKKTRRKIDEVDAYWNAK
jgi:hypothetical protein